MDRTVWRLGDNRGRVQGRASGRLSDGDAELLGLFGYTATSEITAPDCAHAQKLFETLLTFAK
jgi:hypothetical protein